jgi:hypothetical protein
MPRTMVRDDMVKAVVVQAWAITVNGWEYYILSQPDSDGIVEAIVYGDEIERGDVSLREIKPYVATHTADLYEIMPLRGWHWMDTH